MMKSRSMIIGAVVVSMLVACTSLGLFTPRATTRGFDVRVFTQQVQFPGVESNLMSTKVYRVTLDATFPEGVQKFELWVDSVSIPVRLVQDRSGIGMDMGAGRRESVRFTANRHTYRPGMAGSMTLPEETYELSGVRIESGAAWLVHSDRWGNRTQWDLGIPETLPKLYAP